MLGEFLKGLEAREPQTVGNMTVIPLVAPATEYNGVGTVADVYLNRDIAYDRLQMASSAAAPTIIPSGYALITKEKAQDRAVGSKTIIPANKAQEVNAFCVQSSQCGYMLKENKSQQEFRMLPAPVRMVAYKHRDTRRFSALWESLGKYNKSLGVNGDFLKSFFDEHKDRLSQFVAEFELVPYQRGAIILINDELVGVELSPNPLAFSAQWEVLIRDCYGSEAIAKQSRHQAIDESALFGEVDDLEDLEKRLDEVEDREFEFAESQVRMVLEQDGKQSVRQTENDLSVVDIETGEFVGQAVKKATADNGDTIIDLTLLRRDVADRGFKFANSRRRR